MYPMKLRCCWLYNSLILPCVSYCIHVSGKAYDTHLKHVNVLQKMLHGSLVYLRAPMLIICIWNLISFQSKIIVHVISIFICKHINGMLPELFLDMFTPVSDIHNYDTRQAINKNLLVSSKSTARGQQSVTIIGPHVWKFTLFTINPICSIGSFRRNICHSLQHCSVSYLTW